MNITTPELLSAAFIVVAVLVVVALTWASQSSRPGTCPNCQSPKTFRRTQSQTLAALGTGGPKGGRQQVIERYVCSTCGYTLSKNRLVSNQSQPGPSA